jgi:hypothetical protein
MKMITILWRYLTLRCNSLADEWEVSETLDIDLEIVNKHYNLAQTVVA